MTAPPYSVPWIYPVIMLLALISCSWLLRQNQKKLPLTAWQKIALGYGAFCGAMIGAKLPFVITSDWESFRSGLAWITHGKTIMTGLAGGYLGVELVKRWLKIKTRTGDSFAVPVAVAIAIGRIGCFNAGCCFGTPTNLPWACQFALSDGGDAILRHPTQIYESIFHTIMAVVLLVLQRKRIFENNRFKVYLIAYACYRFCSEYIRPEPEWFFALTFYQWCSIGMIIVFSTLISLDLTKPSKTPAPLETSA
jgi:phosphatidylglycerol---prolipoprotein diacylglyceryl transferase